MSNKHDHDHVVYGVDGSINPINKWFRVMRFPTVEQRGYRLGERNPDTLPTGAADRESFHENDRQSSLWRGSKSPLAFALQPGGKYV